MKKKLRLKTSFKLSLIIFVLFLMLDITVFLYFYVNDVEVQQQISYNEKGSLTHIVCLKENEYISEHCFSDNRSFVANLIESIQFDYKYTGSSSVLLDYDYKYTIVAKVVATELNDPSKIVFSEEEVLKEDKISKTSSNFTNSTYTFNIDYPKYNEMINNFKKDYVLALDSNLIIQVNMSIMGNDPTIREAINTSHAMQVTIPLGEQTVSVEENGTKIDVNKTVDKTINPNRTYNATLVFDLLWKIDILVIGLGIFLIIKFSPKQKKYERDIKRILKNYDRAVVKVKKIPAIKGARIIEIETFEEMLDARESLEKPILFYENSTKSVASFIIINNKDCYLYQLSIYDEGDTDEKVSN